MRLICFLNRLFKKKGFLLKCDCRMKNLSVWSRLMKEELNAELEKGYADILAGRTKPAKQAFAEMQKDFDL